MLRHCVTPKRLQVRRNLRSKIAICRSSNTTPTEPPKWKLFASIKGAINRVSKGEVKILSKIPIMDSVKSLKVELPKWENISNTLSPLKDIPNQIIDSTKLGIAQSQNLVNEVRVQARRQVRNKIIKILVLCLLAYLVILGLYMGFIYVGVEFPKWLCK